MINYDSRWVGNNGIGRFAFELKKRLAPMNAFNGMIKPTSPLDCIYLSMYLFYYRGCFFSPGFNAPIFNLNRYIFTIHDLNHVDTSYNSSFFKRIYYKFIMKRACHKAKKVLTVSEFSKKRIVEWSGIASGKIVNVGNGVDVEFNQNAKPCLLGYKYLLCVSNRKLHKNEPRLLQAFAKASIDKNIKLLLTGKINDELNLLIKELKITERVEFTGFIEDGDLPGLYTGALGLVFPSLYEGFGLPVVEAMASGIPVLTSNVASLPEIAGDAAILVDPTSTEKIKQGIEQLVNNQALRHQLIALGLERAKLYSWDKVAEKVNAVLQEALNDSK
ncbi:glycosyltransferase family 4 protein [Aeromonas veronii]